MKLRRYPYGLKLTAPRLLINRIFEGHDFLDLLPF